jgi:proline iminopeptidase
VSEAGSYISANGVRLWTAREGSGLPIVLLHGGPGLYDYFDDFAEMLAGAYEVHRYDQRGSGRSERVPPYDVATFVDDLEALRAHWGHERWIVAGHSWGAALALAYAVAHPDRVEAIVHMDGTGVIDDWREEYHRIADERRTPAQRARRDELRARLKSGQGLTAEEDREYCVLTWASDFADRSLADGYARRFLRDTPPSYDVNAAVGADWSRLLADKSFVDRVHAIAAPVLVLHGALDPRPPRLAERLAASLPNARLAIIPKAGHSPWVEQPKATRQALQQFLAGVRSQAAPAR